ncbi:MAG: penicillin acylase family protein [Melioribacter sp.]|nr:penicillin acylase family protein [Melioribacter sp.]
MKKWKKVIWGVSGSILILTFFLLLISFYMLKKSLPDYNGAKYVKGIISNVIIYRDTFAIPMILAENDEDAAFALGYLHAQERLFQMDIARRAGEGRLSEIFGSKTIAFDKMFRTIGIYRNVELNYEKLHPESKRILLAYANGVNEYIKEAKGKYPIEFDVLGYDPYPWKPEHSLIIAKLMAWELNLSWWSDITFSNIVKRLGVEKAKELLPNYPENAPTIIPNTLEKLANLPTNLLEVDRKFREFIGFYGTHIGSNSWVINGKVSSSKKPIIANDPHLAFTAPGKWYFVIVRSKNWNVEGFTLPGLPSVVIGKNQFIAWGMTNVMADDADFYVEKLDSTGTKYFLDGQWKNLIIEKDSFAVKGSSYYTFEIKKTHRGPIISEIHPYNILYSKEGKITTPISMRWTALEFSDELYSSLLINKASNWNEFLESLKYFTVPGQNFIYADKYGNIGYVCAAKLPIRKSPSPTLIYDGTTSEYDWKGYVPYEEMPKLFNPSQNFIASANNKTIMNFKYHISNIWEPSSRIERIIELLSSKKEHSSTDFKKYQMDIVSPYAKKISQYILSAFHNVKILDNNLKVVLELFDSWDYKLDQNSQVPTIYAVFLNYLIKNTFGDELGHDLLSEYVFLANIPYRKIIELLEGQNNSLFDNIKTQQVETKEEVIRKSLVDAISYLEKKLGSDISKWQWKNIHKVTFKHFFHGAANFIDDIVDIGPYPIGGDGTTIFNTEYSFVNTIKDKKEETEVLNAEPFENTLGPSMRYIFDFGNPDYLEFIMPTGQSGNIMSKHYKDMTLMWLKGQYIKVPLSIEEFKKKSKYKFILIPENRVNN